MLIVKIFKRNCGPGLVGGGGGVERNIFGNSRADVSSTSPS